MNGNTAPVSEGETYDVSIDSVGGKGDGIARVKGFVLFVPNVKKGDYVKIRVKKVLEKVGFADVVGKLEAPPEKPRKRKFATITKEELEQAPEEEESHYDDTEDFGADLDDEE